jgi:hypothetical protein
LKRTLALFAVLLFLSVAGLGCARAARDTTGYSIENSATVDAPFQETWLAAKEVLRDLDLQLYTRDKRGRFVAYSEMQRQLRLFTPHRTQLTVVLDPVGPDRTQVDVESLHQVYGSTLLTHPDWHARPTEDNDIALAILEGIQAEVQGLDAIVEEEAPEAVSAETDVVDVETEDAPLGEEPEKRGFFKRTWDRIRGIF